MRLSRAVPFASVLLASLVGLGSARADLPPPPGTTRVAYSFRVDGTPKDRALIAFPLYRSGGGRVVELTPGKDFTPFQGWTPGIYSVPASLLPTLVGNENDDAVRQTLERQGQVCLKQVPRVFTVPTRTKIRSMVDVFQIDASPSGCKATLSKTLYAGADGEKGEGAADASGRRTPPAPFGNELPPVGDVGANAGATTTPTAAAPPSATASAAPATTSGGAPASRGGCAGCRIASGGDEPGWSFSIAAASALLAGLAARRRGRGGVNPR